MDVRDAAALPRGGDVAAVDAGDIDDGDAPPLPPPSLRLYHDVILMEIVFL